MADKKIVKKVSKNPPKISKDRADRFAWKPEDIQWTDPDVQKQWESAASGETSDTQPPAKP